MQQMDIFPSLIDLLGYDKSLNTWGRSVFSDLGQPFSINYSGTVYHFSMNKFTLVFDGNEVIGVYDIDDYWLENNIINDKTIDFNKEEIYLKAFIQDYMDRIIDKKLNYFKSSE